jgi:polyhydroxyalkanoate synthesis regulator protein
LLNNQEKLQHQVSTSFEQIEEINRRNLEIFENAMQMFNPFSPAGTNDTGASKDAHIADLEKEIEALKQQLRDK